LQNVSRKLWKRALFRHFFIPFPNIKRRKSTIDLLRLTLFESLAIRKCQRKDQFVTLQQLEREGEEGKNVEIESFILLKKVHFDKMPEGTFLLMVQPQNLVANKEDRPTYRSFVRVDAHMFFAIPQINRRKFLSFLRRTARGEKIGKMTFLPFLSLENALFQMSFISSSLRRNLNGAGNTPSWILLVCFLQKSNPCLVSLPRSFHTQTREKGARSRRRRVSFSFSFSFSADNPFPNARKRRKRRRVSGREKRKRKEMYQMRGKERALIF